MTALGEALARLTDDASRTPTEELALRIYGHPWARTSVRAQAPMGELASALEVAVDASQQAGNRRDALWYDGTEVCQLGVVVGQSPSLTLRESPTLTHLDVFLRVGVRHTTTDQVASDVVYWSSLSGPDPRREQLTDWDLAMAWCDLDVGPTVAQLIAWGCA